MKTICIHQPDFAPYLGFFDRLLYADHLILLDDVQFIRRGWQHRDQIKTCDGKRWLSLSVQKGDFNQRILEVLLSDDRKWRDANLALLRQWYAKSRYFKLIYPQIEELYHGKYRTLVDFNMAFLDFAFRLFRIEVQTSFSSSYSVTSSSSQRLLDLVVAVRGDNYLTGMGSLNYLDTDLFEQAGVKIIWQDFVHPNYDQLHGNFLSMLSCLDLFFNCGEHAAQVLRGELSE